jgi:hypothetical protein
MIGAVLGRGLPTAICTIYEPRYPDLLSQAEGAGSLVIKLVHLSRKIGWKYCHKGVVGCASKPEKHRQAKFSRVIGARLGSGC